MSDKTRSAFGWEDRSEKMVNCVPRGPHENKEREMNGLVFVVICVWPQFWRLEDISDTRHKTG